MKIIILAAGYGTRLYPLTYDLPKPLISIHGKPIINFLIENIEMIKNLYHPQISIVSNNKFYKNFLEWREKYHLDVEILNDGSFNVEDKLGAIGDINFAIGENKDDYLILGGDNLFEDNLVEFVKFSIEKKTYPCIALYDVKEKNIAKRFGVVKCNQKKRLLKLEEKPDDPQSTLVSTCVYFFPEESLLFLDKYLTGKNSADVSGKYIQWLIKQTNVFGYVLKGKWFDIGHKDSLTLVEKEF